MNFTLLVSALVLLSALLIRPDASAQINKDRVSSENLLQKKLSPQEMKADIEALVSVLEEAHPFLHEHNPKEAWYKLIEVSKQSIKDSLTQFAFYRLITPIVVSIHEEHTYMAPSSVLEKAHQAQKRILPFQIFVIQNRVFLDSSYTKEAFLPRATELLSINGQSVETILSVIRAKANFATGRETDFAGAILNRGFNFAMGYSYFIEDSAHFIITYRVPASQTLLTAQVTGIVNPNPTRIFPDWGE